MGAQLAHERSGQGANWQPSPVRDRVECRSGKIMQWLGAGLDRDFTSVKWPETT